MSLIFGLDIGTTSVGFAVMEHEPDISTGKILRMGTRIFPETRDAKVHAPLNQQRRTKRLHRRQLRRRRERRVELNTALSELGLLPEFGTPHWEDVMRKDPYEIRSRALDSNLEAWELGRAIYHLAQRRHFRGRELPVESSEEEAAQQAEDRETADEAEKVLRLLRESGQTLGQWLHSLPSGKARRGIRAHRVAVENEFERIWEAQTPHHAALRDPATKSRIREVIFFQRPVFWRKNTLGSCPLIPSAPLCPKGSWLSWQRRMLEKVNNLALVGAGARPLDEEERSAILARLQQQQTMKWSQVRKQLAPVFAARGQKGEEKRLKFNLQLTEKDGLKGNPVEVALRKAIGAEWEGHPAQEPLRDRVHQLLRDADYEEIGNQRIVIRDATDRRSRRERLRKSLVEDFSLSDDAATQVAQMTLPPGWEPFSTEALRRILPELERGARMGELLVSPNWEDWRDATFPERERPTGEVMDRLPSPADPEESRRLAQIRNPTVVRCLNEIRKVVNNLIDLYGKPDLIRVELARDVSRSKRDREEYQRVLRRREAERKKARSELESNSISEPSRTDIQKWLLWQECKQICPYTGDTISFDDLFRIGRFEIEHIWPRSRSLDDSLANKTLCRYDVNLEKGNRTPYEYIGHDLDRWHAVQERLTSLVATRGKPGMPMGKVRRFLATEIPDDFASRLLNDTGYAARAAVATLKRLWPDGGSEMPVTVQPVNGRITGQLRRLWGLNNLLHDGPEKTRDDHRHHAVDALVVACARPGMVHRLSRYWARRDDPGEEAPRLEPPWPQLRDDAQRVCDRIVVSHRVQRKISGQYHKETYHGDTGDEEVRRGQRYRRFVYRKPVNELSRSEIERIRDPIVRQTVREWINEHGGDPKKAFATFPRLGPSGPEIRRVRLLRESKPELMVPLRSGHAEKGLNHHITLFTTDGGNADYEVVSRIEAARRKAQRRPVVTRNSEGGTTFLFSLAPGEIVRIPEGDRGGYWVVTGIWDNGQVILERNNDAAHTTTWRPNARSLVKHGAGKISIDPIGRIRKAAD